MDWWAALIALVALFGIDKPTINSLLKGDENMEAKIAKIKELILDKVTEKVETETLTLDEYSKVVSLVGQISYDPKSLYSSFGQGFNGSAKSIEEK